MNPVLIVFIVICLAVAILFTYGKRVQMDRMAILLECKEYEQFDKVANSFLTKLVVKQYDIEYAKLNSYFVRKDYENVDKQFDLLLKAVQVEERRVNLLMRTFEYYVYEKDKKRSEKILKEIQKLDNKEIIQHCEREFDIVIKKSTDYIEQLEEETKKFDGQRRMVSLYLLKISYDNAGDSKKVAAIEKEMKKSK